MVRRTTSSTRLASVTLGLFCAALCTGVAWAAAPQRAQSEKAPDSAAAKPAAPAKASKRSAPQLRVMLGGQEVSESALRFGISRCQRDSSLPLAECIDRHFVFSWLLDRTIADTPAGQSLGVGRLPQILYEALAADVASKAAAAEPEALLKLAKTRAWDLAQPERIRIFRVLLDDKEDAVEMLAELGANTTLKEFRQLAREHSGDAATKERGGDLGFVWPDGTTDVPQVQVEEQLYAAAAKVRDGEFVPRPVEEAGRWAVVWRRGTLAGAKMDPTQAEALLKRQALELEREKAVQVVLQAGKSSVTRSDDLLARLGRPECKIFERAP